MFAVRAPPCRVTEVNPWLVVETRPLYDVTFETVRLDEGILYARQPFSGEFLCSIKIINFLNDNDVAAVILNGMIELEQGSSLKNFTGAPSEDPEKGLNKTIIEKVLVDGDESLSWSWTITDQMRWHGAARRRLSSAVEFGVVR